MFEVMINILNHFPSEAVLCIEFFTLYFLLSIFSYFFQKNGIYCFMVLTMIAANFQVLKIVNYTFYPEPIALGKVMICFTFLASDVLAECFGRKEAYQGIYLGFLTNVGLMLLMIITLGYPPLDTVKGVNYHEPLKIIFTPLPSIFIAGVVSFLISQLLEVSFFLKLKQKFQGKFLGGRFFLSTVISSLIDNIIFYTLAFYIFNRFVSLDVLIYTYIIGTFIFRCFIICLSSVIIYPIRKLIFLSQSRQSALIAASRLT